MRIISIKKGLEVDSSEGDYYYDYEAIYESYSPDNTIIDFLSSLYYEFENNYPDLLEQLAPIIIENSELTKIENYITDNDIDYHSIFKNVFENYWKQNSFFNEEKLRLKAKKEGPMGIFTDDFTVFHRNSQIFDLFSRESPLVLFSDSIAIEIGELEKMNSKLTLIYDDIIFNLSNPIEFFSFLLLISIHCYEEINEKYKLFNILLFPNGWDFDSYERMEELEEEGILEVPEFGEFDTLNHSFDEKCGLQFIPDKLKPEIKLLNINIFDNLSFIEIRELFYGKSNNFYPVVKEYICKILSDIDHLNETHINDLKGKIQILIEEAKASIRERKKLNSISEKERKEYIDLTRQIQNNPGSYFHQLYNKKELKEGKNNLAKFFHELFPYLDKDESDKQIRKISSEIVDYYTFIGKTEEAIALAINSKNYSKAAELYRQKNMTAYYFGMKYRSDKGLSFSIDQEFIDTQKKTVPVIIDLFPHPKTQIYVAMVQIHLSKDFFEKSRDSNEFFLKEEKEEMIFFLIKNALEKLKDKKIHIIVFPELLISFNPQSEYCFYKLNSPLRSLLIEDAYIKKRIIIPGSYYVGRRNIAPTIFPSNEIIYTIKQTLSNPESSVLEEISIRKGNCTPVFYTNYGKFAILICRDLLNNTLLTEVLEYKPDMIFNPCANKDIKRFGTVASSVVENNKTFIIQPNCFSKEEINYSSSIFSILDHKDIELLKEKELKKDLTTYGIYNSKSTINEISIFSLELKEKRLSIPSLGSDESNIPLKLLEIIELDEYRENRNP